MEALRILVVEDELVIALNITDSLGQLGYKVVKRVSSYNQAVEYLIHNEIDIAILDIKIKGNKSGIDIAQYINDNIKIPFVFLTSLNDPRTFNKAKSLSPAAYLLKPFSRDDLYISIELAMHNFHKELEVSNDEGEKTDLVNENSFIINRNDLFTRIFFKEIVYAKSDHVYTEIATIDGKTHLIRSTMEGILKKLPDNFIRSHRSYIINSDFLEKKTSQQLIVKGVEIPLSRSYQHNF